MQTITVAISPKLQALMDALAVQDHAAYLLEILDAEADRIEEETRTLVSRRAAQAEFLASAPKLDTEADAQVDGLWDAVWQRWLAGIALSGDDEWLRSQLTRFDFLLAPLDENSPVSEIRAALTEISQRVRMGPDHIPYVEPREGEDPAIIELRAAAREVFKVKSDLSRAQEKAEEDALIRWVEEFGGAGPEA